MPIDLARSARAMTYTEARRLIAAAGMAVLLILAAIMYARRVETVEVVAVLLFVPVFLALLRWDILGGAVGGVVAGAVYFALRWPAIHAVGFGSFSGLVVSRVAGLLAFGVIGGWANSQLRTSLTKLDLYDQIDDTTGLFNARYFVLETGLEQARAQRYQTFFAVTVVDVPRSWFRGLTVRQEDRLLRELGRLLRDSVRSVDRVVHSADDRHHRFAAILPETQGDGAALFSERLAVRLGDWLSGHGVRGEDAIGTTVVSFPGDDATLEALRAQFAALDQAEHPLTPQPS